MTVNGSWCHPTISMPKIRSDGARKTGAAMTSVTIVATTEMAATSRHLDSTTREVSCRPVPTDRSAERHECHQDEEETDHGPRADVLHVQRDARVASEEMQGAQRRHSHQFEQHEPRDQAPPTGRDAVCNPERILGDRFLIVGATHWRPSRAHSLLRGAPVLHRALWMS